MTYFGELVLDGTSYPVGSSLYGICNTGANATNKIVNSGVLGNAFDNFIDGITVNILFAAGNTKESINLQIGSTSALPVHGNAKCHENAVLQFTYGAINGVYHWILNAGEKSSIITLNYYDSNSTDPISGQGVADALSAITGGSSAATMGVDTVIGNNPTNDKVPTSLAVANYVDAMLSSNNAMLFKGTLGTGGTISALPSNGYKAGEVYKIITNGIYAGLTCEEGDLIISIQDAGEYLLGIINTHWTVILTNLVRAVTGPSNAVTGNVVIFGADSTIIDDSGFTIETSVPANAVFTDTLYENTGYAQAVTNIEVGDDIAFATVSNGVLHITTGIDFTQTSVSTGIQEVI